MPQDERKRQKALMKKRSKQKAHTHQRTLQAKPTSSQTIIREARTFTLLGCWINKNWQKKDDLGLVEVVIARLQPDGDVCFGSYLIDKFCLGLKNTFARTNFSRARFEKELDEMFREM